MQPHLHAKSLKVRYYAMMSASAAQRTAEYFASGHYFAATLSARQALTHANRADNPQARGIALAMLNAVRAAEHRYN